MGHISISGNAPERFLRFGFTPKKKTKRRHTVMGDSNVQRTNRRSITNRCACVSGPGNFLAALGGKAQEPGASPLWADNSWDNTGVGYPLVNPVALKKCGEEQRSGDQPGHVRNSPEQGIELDRLE